MSIKVQRQLLTKLAFLNNITSLSAKDAQLVMKKLKLVAEDPLPDGDFKKELKSSKYKDVGLHRARAGDYRIVYRFDQHVVTALTVRRRKENTYRGDVKDDWDDDLDADLLSENELELTPFITPRPAAPAHPSWDYTSDQSKPLPEPITVELLTHLRIPTAYHARLQQVKTEDALFECPGVAMEHIVLLHDHMFEKPISAVLQQPDLLVNEVDDLMRYKDGDLLAFLLRLSPEQERYARWSLTANGPTLVKGGPGTGKSTVALYRIRSLIEQLRTTGVPRILFSTYTNALIRMSCQLLEQLLGADDAQYVTVLTADKMARDILVECQLVKEIIGDGELKELTQRALDETPLEGNSLRQLAQRQTLERIGLDYLLQEITNVIVARQLESVEAYLATSRAGRQMRLSPAQRRLIWSVYEYWRGLIEATGRETWQQQRARAASLIKHSAHYHAYDAVVIDEAQDLDPCALRMFIDMCKAPNRLFITADANQSIYGSGFNWSDVHESLKFQGRASLLRTNYRSTRQIGEAAHNYLNDSALDPERIEHNYIFDGPRPHVLYARDSQSEAQLLVDYIRKATRSVQHPISSCAILCPGKNSGHAIVQALKHYGITAYYMSSSNLDLKKPGVKVLPFKASKGLEFPIVALAGFVNSSYPSILDEVSDDERAEHLAQERRTIFVSMTRAMRSLLLILPAQATSPLYRGLDAHYWDIETEA